MTLVDPLLWDSMSSLDLKLSRDFITFTLHAIPAYEVQPYTYGHCDLLGTDRAARQFPVLLNTISPKHEAYIKTLEGFNIIIETSPDFSIYKRQTSSNECKLIMSPPQDTVENTRDRSTDAAARISNLNRERKFNFVPLCVRPSWPTRPLESSDEVPAEIIQLGKKPVPLDAPKMSTDKQTAQDQLCQGPLLMVWSTQRIPCRTSWPTNFPDDTIVWFQGQDRQMIPFDRVTGALRLDVELFAETEHEAHLGPQNNQVDSANQGQSFLQRRWSFELMSEQMMAYTVLT